MAKIIIEVTDELRNSFKAKVAKTGNNIKTVLTKLIIQYLNKGKK